MLSRLFVALAVCLLLGGCDSASSGLRMGSCNAPPQNSDCGSDLPSQGMYCIQESVKWNEYVIKDPASGAQQFRFKQACVITAGGQCINLIAGAIGDPNSPDICTKGVLPPSKTPKFKAGLNIQSTPGSYGNTERATLAGGFIVMTVSQGSPTMASFWHPWPFIVGTPTLPGGAYSGICVFLTVPDTDGTSLRECVFRPNQRALCDNFDSPNNDSSEEIHVDWSDKFSNLWRFDLKTVSYVDYFNGDANSTKVSDDEGRFLRDVCKFRDQATSYLNMNPQPLPVNTGCP
jgi:hypothetical protein